MTSARFTWSRWSDRVCSARFPIDSLKSGREVYGMTRVMPFLMWAAAIFCTTFLTACKKPHDHVYQIPPGYTGWAMVLYESEACPPIPLENGKLIFKLGPNGQLCTSSRVKGGWATRSFYYMTKPPVQLPVTAAGGGGKIWGLQMGAIRLVGRAENPCELFFVGPEAEFVKAEKLEPLGQEPK